MDASSGQQRLEEPEVAEVLAVRRRVLAHEEQLPHAVGGQPPGLVEEVGRAPAHERAAERRDRAEGAASVAAGRQLQRRHRTGGQPRPRGHRRGAPIGGRDRQQPAPVLRGVRVLLLPRHDRAQPGRDVGVVVEAEHRVGLGQRLGQLGAVPLSHAADRHDRLRPALAVISWPLRSAASSSASTLSFLACSTKPQVLTSTVSAPAGSSTSRNPSAASRPASSSESTSLRAHPSVTTATDSC